MSDIPHLFCYAKDMWNCLGGSGDTANKIPQLSCVFPLFQDIITAALGLAGIVAIIFIIYAGVKFLLSGGDAKRVSSARNTLTYAIIGLLLIFFSFAIIFFIANITGVNCIKQFGFNNCGGVGVGTGAGSAQPNGTPQ